MSDRAPVAARRQSSRPRRVADGVPGRGMLWLAAAGLAALAGWTAGSHALGPVEVPGPTTTVSSPRVVPGVPIATVDAAWSADPASPLPAGIPEGRHPIERLVIGTYLGVPANPARPCQWQRLGPEVVGGLPAVHERGSGSSVSWVTLRASDGSFVSSGCQWRLASSR